MLKALLIFYLTLSPLLPAKSSNEQSENRALSTPIKKNEPSYVEANYSKQEVRIPMRDGITMFTSIYIPRDASNDNLYPIMLTRTPYGVGPYGEDKYPNYRVGPSTYMMKEKYIFVYQDVRGRFMSEGEWTNMTPHIPDKTTNEQVDESSDAFDTIEWLLENLEYDNGKVGMWGISYPGQYAADALVSSHSALKAVSPQAPIADFYFNDFHHNGAYTLGYFYNTPLFGIQKKENTDQLWMKFFDKPTKDAYQFFLELGPLKNAAKYYDEENFFWQELTEHPNYDEFWQKRNLLPHLNEVDPAVMTVGGWFDAEDLHGPLSIYKTIEKNNPDTYNMIVMGPFGHGGWSYERGHHSHHEIYFGDSIASHYQQEIEAKFFYHFLKGPANGQPKLPEAYMYNTGYKMWSEFKDWPPNNVKDEKYFLNENGELNLEPPAEKGFTTYISDPDKPVPYTMDIPGSFGLTPRNYMSEDQRFAARRPDVLTFETAPLVEPVTLAGEIRVHLNVSTTGTDADFVVKLVDVYPGDAPNTPYTPKHVALSHYQQLVRGEIMRGRYRENFSEPKPFEPNQPTVVTFDLQDVLHTFKPGHKIMIQVQSTWFPLFDRNPQKYVPNIFKADEEDFIKAEHRIYHDPQNPSYIEFDILVD